MGILIQQDQKDWGNREKHPYYGLWTWRKGKHNCSMCSEWHNDFWKFVSEIGERPNKNFKLQRISKDKPYSIENFEWVEVAFKMRRSEDSKQYARRFQRAYRQSEKGKIALKKSSLKRDFGISLNEYNDMLKKQNNVCAVCGKKETARNIKTNKVCDLAVDHCHKTGVVRGLLCSKCNTGLGFFADSKKDLTLAIKYLAGA